MNQRTSEADFGTGHFRMRFILLLSASIPLVEMWCLRKSTSAQNRWVFFGFTYRLASCNERRTARVGCVICHMTYTGIVGTPNSKLLVSGFEQVYVGCVICHMTYTGIVGMPNSKLLVSGFEQV